MSRTESRTRSRTRSVARRAGSTASLGARTAREHPQAAVSGVGIVGVGGALLAGVVVLKVLRSRRVRRLAATSADRGAFGPGVATASRVMHLVRDREDQHHQDDPDPSDAAAGSGKA